MTTLGVGERIARGASRRMDPRVRSDRPDFAALTAEAILAHLAEIDLTALDALRSNPSFGERHLVAIAGSPSVPEEVLEALLQDRELSKHYRVRAALAMNPRLPRPHALELVHQLFWHDLLRVAENVRLHPQVRRAAEHLLADLVESLTLGEKVALARMATRGVIGAFRREAEPKVVEALLQNPRLAEEDIVAMAGRADVPAGILRQIATSPRWSSRYPVRLALARNPSTPPAVTLGFLSALAEADLRGLLSRPGVATLVREGARNLLEALAARR